MGGQHFGKYQMTFVSVHIFVGVAIDEGTIEAGMSVKIDDEINLVALRIILLVSFRTFLNFNIAGIMLKLERRQPPNNYGRGINRKGPAGLGKGEKVGGIGIRVIDLCHIYANEF